MIDTDEGPTPETAAKLAAMDTDPMTTPWHNGESTVYHSEATQDGHNAVPLPHAPVNTAGTENTGFIRVSALG